MTLCDFGRKEQAAREERDCFVSQANSNELNPLLEAQEKLRLLENEISAFNFTHLHAERLDADIFL